MWEGKQGETAHFGKNTLHMQIPRHKRVIQICIKTSYLGGMEPGCSSSH